MNEQMKERIKKLQKEKLEKERDRLTKTINELTHRLEFVEESPMKEKSCQTR